MNKTFILVGPSFEDACPNIFPQKIRQKVSSSYLITIRANLFWHPFNKESYIISSISCPLSFEKSKLVGFQKAFDIIFPIEIDFSQGD